MRRVRLLTPVGLLGLLGLLGAGCTGTDWDVRVERQATKLASATDDGWQVGGGVFVGEPGSITFPQYVALRISLVDSNNPDADGNPLALPVDEIRIESTGLAAGDLSVEPTCDGTACTAELLVLEAGSTMLQIGATSGDGNEDDCWYYAVQEDADPATAVAALRADLEAQQTACRKDVQ
jgi:hypothetical protein